MTEVKRENAVKIEGRHYIVVSPDLCNDWAVGTILTLSEDDGTNLPWFTDKSGNGAFVYMYEVMLLAETEEKAEEPVKPKLPEHKYTVGQKLTVKDNRYVYAHYLDVNEEVIVTKVGGIDDKFYGSVPMYRVESILTSKEQTLLETQLEPVAPHITEEQYAAIAVGDTIVIRDDLDIGKYGEDSVVEEMLLQKGKQLTVKAVVGNTSGVRVEESIYNWTQQMIAEVIQKEKSEHKYSVGDRVKIIETDNSERVGTTRTGDMAIIKELEDYSGRTHTENGTPYYKVRTDSGCIQVLTEYQLSKLDKKPVFLLEEGQFYLADQTGNYSHNWIIKAGEITDDSVEMGFALSTDNASYTTWGELPFSDVTKWTPATDEQKIQLLTAMAEHGDATDSDLELLSELMPLDNPDVEVGEVYVDDDNWTYRHKDSFRNYPNTTTGFQMSPSGDGYLGGWIPIIDHRKALPHEVAKLEAAEKEHGCEYKKPLINSKGTVIEVGQYYTENEISDGVKSVSLITEISEDNSSFTEHFINLHPQYFHNDQSMKRDANEAYAQHLVPATPEEIAEFKAAENRSKISKGQKYLLEGIVGNKQEIEVTNVTDNGTVQFKYRSIFDNTVCAGLSVDSHFWKTAELLN